ncbi:DNA-binding transcriptional regulator, MarR family [Tistlia consotensis]|uniref:DNA-binding transcriptional regulator, MarR family n=1 Tax=Tistlia consotensis USBA 355 TaxID=560819 RepID=A0A1Y6C3P5_9PROT|nr:MarR family transcriptional regulator [Tistlia consotensis]SMF32128.1 DNA-binding transcriptional regulator, MarR family [Tistlia consotensis USBA 355]SNR68175.1 DNA-binding transcriptional regulator, MarR family [Tistlia consotensis]
MTQNAAGNLASPDIDPAFDIVGRGMAQWRRQRPDIDCSGKAIVGRILRLQDVILRAVNVALERHGLRYPAYAVLATLRASGPPFRMSPSRLRETLLLTSGGTSNLLARLEGRGWLVRRADPLDGRAVIVELTEAGRELADQAMADHAEVERELVRMFSQAEQGAFAAMLSRMLVLNGASGTSLPRDRADGPEAGDGEADNEMPA